MNVTKIVRLAVVGAGWAGSRQIEAVAELGRHIEVVALIDNDAEFLARQARKLGVAKRYSDLREALEDPDIDAVSICTPHALHMPMAMAVAEAGRHILVEKPMATTVADATRMLEAAAANGVCLFVAESDVYQPHIAALREIVQTGRYIGNLVAAAYVTGYRAPDASYPGRRSWLTQPAHGGSGAWMLNGIHAVAQLRRVLGEVRTVYILDHKAPTYQRHDIEGTMSGVLTMEDGLVVWLVHTPEVQFPPTGMGFQLYGDRGIVLGHRNGYRVVGDDIGGEDFVSYEYGPRGLSPYALQMEAFFKFIVDGTGPTDGISERRSLAIIEAGIESAARGIPVDLAQRFGTL